MSTNRPFDFFIQWHLTEKCNLACRHCYQGERDRSELSLSEIRDVIAEASDMILDWSEAYQVRFSPSFTVTGGEPFLRQDLFAVLGELRKRGIDAVLLTNGTMVDRERATMLRELGISGVQVSIEGPEEVHDAIRGAGSFAAASVGIGRLVDAGIEVTLNATISELNAGHMNEVVAIGTNMGVKRVGFSRLVPHGRGSFLLSRMLPTDQVKELYTSLLGRAFQGIDIVTGDPVAAQMKESGEDDAGDIAVSGCAAGVAGLTILPNGDVLPCRRMAVPLGNVRKDSLREIWAASPVLEALRDRSRYTGKCRTCNRWAHCRGCRAVAYAWSRSHGKEDYLGDDPQCFLTATAS